MTGGPDGPRFRRSPAGAVALTVLAVGLGGWGIVNSPVFDTRRIEVLGVRRVARADVVAASGVRTGDNLFRLSLADVASRIERHPWVREARADRDLPDVLRIRVIERTPVGWFAGGGGVVLVARDGTVLEIGADTPSDLPALGEETDPLSPGARVPSIPATLRVVASMNGTLLRAVSAAVIGETGVSLELRGGGSVDYGEPTRLGEKNRSLARMLRWARRNDVEVRSVDLRVPEAPTLEPVEPPPGPSPSA